MYLGTTALGTVKVC